MSDSQEYQQRISRSNKSDLNYNNQFQNASDEQQFENIQINDIINEQAPRRLNNNQKQRGQGKNSKSTQYREGIQINSYLKKFNKSFQNSKMKSSIFKSQEDQDSDNDKQVKKIINQVLDRRKRMSRISNNSNLTDRNLNTNKDDNNMLNIQRVNYRLRKQNQQLTKSIRNLLKKIKKVDIQFSKISQSKEKQSATVRKQPSYSSKIQGTTHSFIQLKQRQLEKLRKRLQNAEKSNSRMELQLSKIYQSRKSFRKNSKDKTRNNQKDKNQNYIACQNCKGMNVKLISKQIVSSKNSPSKDFYSPIMQFQEYNLKNQQTSLQQNQSLRKTSQFGLQLQQVQNHENKEQKNYNYIHTDKSSKQIQVQMQISQKFQQQSLLDQQIMNLEAIIKKNNISLSRFERISLKEFI